MDARAAQAAVERLRGFRVRAGRPASIEAEVEAARREAGHRRRAVGGIERAWEEVVPEALRARCALVRFSRGVVTVKAFDGAAMYELDRFLRAGGEARLARVAGAPVRRVRVVA